MSGGFDLSDSGSDSHQSPYTKDAKDMFQWSYGPITVERIILIVALYVIELVIIMTYFTTKIEEDNDLLVKLNIARYTPIAVIMFVVSILAAKAFVGVAI